ncbi:hypothetical protein RVIR1_05760 [Candidatus Rickettsiella viridis]|uniref:Uncharacterized protein n=2 Tax=Candidatus Rickettsiella viridis TaxID=676208 RepID=A0A2Z5UUB8_9COXI|nr:hypothetical protein RVIR1_05760 [Candidatus Rickettsiella viridis]
MELRFTESTDYNFSVIETFSEALKNNSALTNLDLYIQFPPSSNDFDNTHLISLITAAFKKITR